jgi:hypothetical protein
MPVKARAPERWTAHANQLTPPPARTKAQQFVLPSKQLLLDESFSARCGKKETPLQKEQVIGRIQLLCIDVNLRKFS